MPSNDNEHPVVRRATELLDAEMTRLLRAETAGEITTEEQVNAMRRLARATVDLPRDATVEDVERALVSTTE